MPSAVPVFLVATPNITCNCGNLTAKYAFASGPNGSDPNYGYDSVFYTLPGQEGSTVCHNLCIKAVGKGGKPVYYTSPNTSSVQYVGIFTYCPTANSCTNYAVLYCHNASGDGLFDKKGEVVWSCAQQGLVPNLVPLTTEGYIKPVAISCDGGCGALKKKGKGSQVKKCKLIK